MNNTKLEKLSNTGKVLKGTVVSDKGNKTVVVSVERFIKHRRYGKYIRRQKRFQAHDPSDGKYRVGDKVLIKETRPQSRHKHFAVVDYA
jgi:small subunit ribosomal protein S17